MAMRTAFHQRRGVDWTDGNRTNCPKQRAVDGRVCCSPMLQATWTPCLCRSKDVRLGDGGLEDAECQQTEVASARCGFETLQEDLRTVCGIGIARSGARYPAGTFR